ncbi:MAG TPA: GNAT family N-acetyltransferase [Gemmatimonadaceae bacterium]|nr:GNAT family N-acetyltransferase [Gemmatimonadaceae bacterium]
MIRVREIRESRDPAFDAAHGLLRRIFPRSEMMPRRAWVQVLREREQALWTDLNWHLFVAERGGRVIGAASGSYLGNVNVGVIGYVAVDRAARAKGLGPRLRRALVRGFRRDARDVHGADLRAVVGEVHDDNPWLRTLVSRHHALALDFPYYQPALHRSEPGVPLVMYYEPVGVPRHWLSAAEVRRLLYTMWRRAYRVASPLKDRNFRRMLRALHGRRRIGVRPVLPRTRRHRHSVS